MSQRSSGHAGVEPVDIGEVTSRDPGVSGLWRLAWRNHQDRVMLAHQAGRDPWYHLHAAACAQRMKEFIS
jgi:hypothetical protein